MCKLSARTAHRFFALLLMFSIPWRSSQMVLKPVNPLMGIGDIFITSSSTNKNPNLQLETALYNKNIQNISRSYPCFPSFSLFFPFPPCFYSYFTPVTCIFFSPFFLYIVFLSHSSPLFSSFTLLNPHFPPCVPLYNLFPLSLTG